jgi:hypothetical protein
MSAAKHRLAAYDRVELTLEPSPEIAVILNDLYVTATKFDPGTGGRIWSQSRNFDCSNHFSRLADEGRFLLQGS